MPFPGKFWSDNQWRIFLWVQNGEYDQRAAEGVTKIPSKTPPKWTKLSIFEERIGVMTSNIHQRLNIPATVCRHTIESLSWRWKRKKALKIYEKWQNFDYFALKVHFFHMFKMPLLKRFWNIIIYLEIRYGGCLD